MCFHKTKIPYQSLRHPSTEICSKYGLLKCVMLLKLMPLRYYNLSCWHNISKVRFSLTYTLLYFIITPLQITINGSSNWAHGNFARVKTKMLTFLVKITSRNILLFSFVFISFSNFITLFKYHDYDFENSNKILCDIQIRHIKFLVWFTTFIHLCLFDGFNDYMKCTLWFKVSMQSNTA